MTWPRERNFRVGQAFQPADCALAGSVRQESLTYMEFYRLRRYNFLTALHGPQQRVLDMNRWLGIALLALGSFCVVVPGSLDANVKKGGMRVPFAPLWSGDAPGAKGKD